LGRGRTRHGLRRFSHPSSVAHRDLALPFAGTARATLGDGNEVKMDLFLAGVVWEEEPCEVLVLAAEGGVLLEWRCLPGAV